MQEAIDYYGRLQDVFKVSLSKRVVFLLRVIYHGFIVYRSRWCSLKWNTTLCGEELQYADV